MQEHPGMSCKNPAQYLRQRTATRQSLAERPSLQQHLFGDGLYSLRIGPAAAFAQYLPSDLNSSVLYRRIHLYLYTGIRAMLKQHIEILGGILGVVGIIVKFLAYGLAQTNKESIFV